MLHNLFSHFFFLLMDIETIETISNVTIYFLETTLKWKLLPKALHAHVQVFLQGRYSEV